MKFKGDECHVDGIIVIPSYSPLQADMHDPIVYR